MTLRIAADTAQKFKPPPEREVQKGIVELFRKAGVHVGSTSQYRASHIEEGIPDLLCHATSVHRFWWFEVKSYCPTVIGPTGAVRFNPYDRSTWCPRPLSPKQEEFRMRALACGIMHMWGGVQQAEDALIGVGLGERTTRGVFQYTLRRAS